MTAQSWLMCLGFAATPIVHALRHDRPNKDYRLWYAVGQQVRAGQPLYPVTVTYATANGTATANSDYLPTSGALGFPVGVNTRTIKVTVLGDKTREPNETFFLNLSNPSPNAYLGDSQGLGTIGNDD